MRRSRRVRKHPDVKELRAVVGGLVCSLMNLVVGLANEVILKLDFMIFDGFFGDVAWYAIPCIYCAVKW